MVFYRARVSCLVFHVGFSRCTVGLSCFLHLSRATAFSTGSCWTRFLVSLLIQARPHAADQVCANNESAPHCRDVPCLDFQVPRVLHERAQHEPGHGVSYEAGLREPSRGCTSDPQGVYIRSTTLYVAFSPGKIGPNTANITYTLGCGGLLIALLHVLLRS